MNPLPDWKLPAGTSRGLWAYLHDRELARDVDQLLADNPLLINDLAFVERIFQAPGSVIDLGCGTGRFLLRFAQLGFRVFGVDLSAEMLAVAAHKANEMGLPIPLAQMNLVDMSAVRDSQFDYSVCLFSTLGMVMGREHRRKVLEHIYRILKPGGRLVLHVHNRWFHLGTRAGRRWLWKDLVRQWMGSADAGDYEMPAHQGIRGLALHHFSRAEIRRELHRAGLGIDVMEPVSLHSDSRLRMPWCWPGLRAYGFLIGAHRPPD